jgi:hypothetical protein
MKNLTLILSIMLLFVGCKVKITNTVIDSSISSVIVRAPFNEVWEVKSISADDSRLWTLNGVITELPPPTYIVSVEASGRTDLKPFSFTTETEITNSYSTSERGFVWDTLQGWLYDGQHTTRRPYSYIIESKEVTRVIKGEADAGCRQIIDSVSVAFTSASQGWSWTSDAGWLFDGAPVGSTPPEYTMSVTRHRRSQDCSGKKREKSVIKVDFVFSAENDWSWDTETRGWHSRSDTASVAQPKYRTVKTVRNETVKKQW